jgi:hypothetical protein
VHSEYLLVNDSCDGQAVEAICEGFPQFDIVPPLALIVEAIDAVDWSAFVVASKNKEVLWVFDFVCQKEADGFQRLFASVHIVTEE